MVDHQMHAHAHCLRSEQCACTYDLNTKTLPEAVHVQSGPGPDKQLKGS